jgi:hypothetical protein
MWISNHRSTAGLAGLVQLDGQQKLLDDHLLDLYIYYVWNLKRAVRFKNWNDNGSKIRSKGLYKWNTHRIEP